MLSFLTSVATLYLAFIPELLYMEKTKVERDFPECSAAAAAGNVTLGICQRKVSARCFLLLLKAAVLVQFFLPPLPYYYSVIVC